jgi:hypothetical protein
MTCNVGGADRGIRLLLGIALLALALTHTVTGTMAIVAYVVGGIALVTAAVRFCPAWAIFGINTTPTAHK